MLTGANVQINTMPNTARESGNPDNLAESWAKTDEIFRLLVEGVQDYAIFIFPTCCIHLFSMSQV
jgi:hypothetical protein